MSEETGRGRKPKHGAPMSVAERKRESRAAKRAEKVKEVAESKAAQPPATQEVAPKKRKQRSDSSSAMVAAMTAVDKDRILPPSYMPMTDDAMQYWDAIIKSRAREDWTDAELVTAASLAKCHAQIAAEEELMMNEQSVIFTQVGEVKINPRVQVIEIHIKRSLALMRTLRMGGKVAGDPRTLANGRLVEGEARQVRDEVEDSDGLLA